MNVIRKLVFLSVITAAPLAHGASVSSAFTNGVTGNPDTNTFFIWRIGPVRAADGGFNTIGIPIRVTPSADGKATNSLPEGNFLATNAYLGSGIVFRAPNDSGNTVYSMYDLRISGYGTFVTIYRTNAPATSGDITNALGFQPLSPTQTTQAVNAAWAQVTNGYTTIVKTNPATVVYTNDLVALTNGYVKTGNTNGLASMTSLTSASNVVRAWADTLASNGTNNTIGYVATATNSLETRTVTLINTTSNSLRGLVGSGGGSATNIAPGSLVTFSTNGSGIISVSAVSQTNGQTTLTTTNATSVLYTNYLPALTNGFVQSGVTQGLISVTEARALTNGNTSLVTTNAYSVLYTNYLPALTNGFVQSGITNGLASVTTLNSSSNVVRSWADTLASNGTNNTTGYVQFATNASETRITTAYTASKLSATNALDSQLRSVLAATNDTRELKFTNEANIYAGRMTNGLNVGNAFSSPGTATVDGAEQFGEGATANGNNTTAMGDTAAATGPGATAIGAHSIATGDAALTYAPISIGYTAESTNIQTIAIGSGAKAYGIDAMAFGGGAKATNNGSFALGVNAKAYHQNSMAFGVNAQTTTSNQLIFGDSSDTVYFPGNGTISGVFSNGTLATTNMYLTGNPAFATGTNVIAFYGSGNVSNDVGFTWNGATYTNEQTRCWAWYQTPTWYLVNPAGVNQYSKNSVDPAGAWTVVNGSSPAPTAYWGPAMDMRSLQVLGEINSTNLAARLANASTLATNFLNTVNGTGGGINGGSLTNVTAEGLIAGGIDQVTTLINNNTLQLSNAYFKGIVVVKTNASGNFYLDTTNSIEPANIIQVTNGIVMSSGSVVGAPFAQLTILGTNNVGGFSIGWGNTNTLNLTANGGSVNPAKIGPGERTSGFNGAGATMTIESGGGAGSGRGFINFDTWNALGSGTGIQSNLSTRVSISQDGITNFVAVYNQGGLFMSQGLMITNGNSVWLDRTNNPPPADLNHVYLATDTNAPTKLFVGNNAGAWTEK